MHRLQTRLQINAYTAVNMNIAKSTNVCRQGYKYMHTLLSILTSQKSTKVCRSRLVVFYLESTARSFREGTPFTVPCKGREAQFLRTPCRLVAVHYTTTAPRVVHGISRHAYKFTHTLLSI